MKIYASLIATVLATALIGSPVLAQDKKISALPAASTLSGSEKLSSVQGAGCATSTAPCANVVISPPQIATYVSANGPLAISRQFFTPANGGTTNVVASTARELTVFTEHTATIASHTINMPTLLDGQRIHFRSSGAVTTLTLNPPSGATVYGNITSLTVGGHASFEFVASGNRLFRID